MISTLLACLGTLGAVIGAGMFFCHQAPLPRSGFAANAQTDEWYKQQHQRGLLGLCFALPIVWMLWPWWAIDWLTAADMATERLWASAALAVGAILTLARHPFSRMPGAI